jgi:hypothetical protein
MAKLNMGGGLIRRFLDNVIKPGKPKIKLFKLERFMYSRAAIMGEEEGKLSNKDEEMA